MPPSPLFDETMAEIGWRDHRWFIGRHILITGAGHGIGAGVTRAFLACGARVLAHVGRKPAAANGPLLQGLSAHDMARLVLVEGDLSQLEGIETLLKAAQDFSPLLDVLVNNAGDLIARRQAQDNDLQYYNAVLDLNIRQLVLLTCALIPKLASAPHGAILNTSSISARTGGSPGSALYSGAKAFVSTYSRALARELAPLSIRVNAIAPGTIDTAFHQRHSSPAKLAATAQTIPLGRLGSVEDCLGAYLFLANPCHSGYITGQVLEVNGGQFMA
jgi:3-oxoacyl-[acyl-carrier protein] reductase